MWRIWRIWRKWRFWRNLVKAVDKMLRANILTSQKGPGKVGEYGESIPSPFYEARFGVEIFVELYDTTVYFF